MSSPLLYTYLKKYQDDPTSRVFAPLAEAYRKAGLLDEAIEIARDGLRIHPGFIGGRVALARSLFDKKNYEEVLRELVEVVQDAPDNLAAQRLFGESCLMLGRVAEALGAYKMLLFYSPQDLEAAQVVRELESQAYEGGALVLREDQGSDQLLPEFSETRTRGAIDEDPDLKRARWIQRVEGLQHLLLRVERYRKRTSLT
jgi:tetratricopeptide (TPR) repeat protein